MDGANCSKICVLRSSCFASMMMHKRLACRGGARRERAELDIDDSVLLDCFGKHHALISNLGVYETKSTKDQPDGKG